MCNQFSLEGFYSFAVIVVLHILFQGSVTSSGRNKLFEQSKMARNVWSRHAYSKGKIVVTIFSGMLILLILKKHNSGVRKWIFVYFICLPWHDTLATSD